MKNCYGWNTTPKMSRNGQKGAGTMYSLCIKFKDDLGWRPMCRQAHDCNEAMHLTQEAFDKWPVKHVSLFFDGSYLRTFFWPPYSTAAARNYAKQKLLHHEKQSL